MDDEPNALVRVLVSTKAIPKKKNLQTIYQMKTKQGFV